MGDKEKIFTEELMQKARECRTAEEIAALAKENGMEITAAEAEEYFRMVSPATGELADEELDNVAGGSCGSGSGSSTSTYTYPCVIEFESGIYLGNVMTTCGNNGLDREYLQELGRDINNQCTIDTGSNVVYGVTVSIDSATTWHLIVATQDA